MCGGAAVYFSGARSLTPADHRASEHGQSPGSRQLRKKMI
jgi:hypothetical protein